MAKTLKLTVRQATHLLRAAFSLMLPEKIGTRTFQERTKRRLSMQAMQLVSDIAAISPLYRKFDLKCAGPESAWNLIETPVPVAEGAPARRPKRDAEERDPKMLIEVPLTTLDSQDAAAWAALLWVWPSSPSFKNPGFLEEMAPPLIEQLGVQDWIDRMIKVEGEDDEDVDDLSPRAAAVNAG